MKSSAAAKSLPPRCSISGMLSQARAALDLRRTNHAIALACRVAHRLDLQLLACQTQVYCSVSYQL